MAAMDDDEGDCVAAAAAAGVEHRPKEPLMRPVHSSAAVAAAEEFAAVVGAVEGMPLVFFRWIQSLAEAVGLAGLGDWRAWQERNLKRLGKLSISHILHRVNTDKSYSCGTQYKSYDNLTIQIRYIIHPYSNIDIVVSPKSFRLFYRKLSSFYKPKRNKVTNPRREIRSAFVARLGLVFLPPDICVNHHINSCKSDAPCFAFQ
jgi:hypothetical protein